MANYILAEIDFPDIGKVAVTDKLLGEGSLARAYLAHTRDERAVVAKVPSPNSNWPELILTELFAREAALHIPLPSHENIICARAAGSCAHFGPSLLLELADGDTLGNYLLNGELFPWSEAIELAMALCRAAAHIHDHGVLHLDINPANILYDRSSREVRLFDFNASQSLRGKHWDVDGCVLGNPTFASPETRKGKVSPASDVYSIAATLFALGTGCGPPNTWTQSSEFGVWGNEQAGSRGRSSVNLPEGLDRIYRQATDPNPTQRIQSAEELANALAQI